MKIAVIGTGYVGLANAVLLAQRSEVVAVDINPQRVEMLQRRISPLDDGEISQYLGNPTLDFCATTDYKRACEGADFVIVATPTDYDASTQQFDTKSVDSAIQAAIHLNPSATVVIKSTVPVGYTATTKEEYPGADLLFSPEFLREGKALLDNLYPSRIIVGGVSPRSQLFAKIMRDGALKSDVPILLTGSTEAEAIKLFANAYLAMRVAFINELDGYAELKGLKSRDIIDGISLDPRIGCHYNNPSFGYGGYCLPKDTKQLLANYSTVPQSLFSAIVESNEVRKSHVFSQVLKSGAQTVGIYRLIMKAGSDNFRSAAIFDVMSKLKEAGVNVIVHEPTWKQHEYCSYEVEADLDRFKRKSELILANRADANLKDVMEKVYSRDIFGCD